MASTLKVVSEVEVPNPAVEQAQAAPASEAKSTQSYAVYQATLEVLSEIRKILSVRAAAMLGMLGALGLTSAAMVQQTTMALLIALSFDLAVFLPIAVIAYCRKSGQ